MAGVLPVTLRVALRSKFAPGDFVNIIFTSISSDQPTKKEPLNLLRERLFLMTGRGEKI